MTDIDPPDPLQLLLDEAAIHRVLMRYVRGTDRRDIELVRSCYHDDAIDDHGNFVGSPDEFVVWSDNEMSKFSFSTHHMTNIIIEVCGDMALVESYALGINGGEPITDSVKNYVAGFRYIDRFERRSGEWRIAERHIVLDWTERWEPHRAKLERHARVGKMGPDDLLFDVGSRVPGSRRHSRA